MDTIPWVMSSFDGYHPIDSAVAILNGRRDNPYKRTNTEMRWTKTGQGRLKQTRRTKKETR